MTIGVTNFPTAADDYTSIPTAVNDVVTVLVGGLNADSYGNLGVSTDIAVADASLLPVVGWVNVGGEIISFTGKSGNTLNGCVRGAQSTSIVAHANRSPVHYNFTAAHFNVLVAGLIAVQNLLLNFITEQGTTDGGATITLNHSPVTTGGRKTLLFINGVFYTDGSDFNIVDRVLTFAAGNPPAGMPYTLVYFRL